MTHDILYSGSQSKARQRLLDFAGITYRVLAHASDEKTVEPLTDFAAYVLAIAQAKMRALTFPSRAEVPTDYLFVLTADTLIRTTDTNQILGKPLTRSNAIAMLREECKAPVQVMTGCCLEKYYWRDTAWQRGEQKLWSSSTLVEFCVDDQSIDRYFESFPFILQCAGAAAVEDYGLAYLKSINGSFTGVVGLPLYELRTVLSDLGFIF